MPPESGNRACLRSGGQAASALGICQHGGTSLSLVVQTTELSLEKWVCTPDSGWQSMSLNSAHYRLIA
jgi:hypothetical protein